MLNSNFRTRVKELINDEVFKRPIQKLQEPGKLILITKISKLCLTDGLKHQKRGIYLHL